MKKNDSLILLLTNLFITFLGIGLVIPDLPTIMNELGLYGKMVGYLVAAFAVSQLLISPLAGKWVDRFGRKPMIIMGLLIFIFSELLFGLGKTVEMLFASILLVVVSAVFIVLAVIAFISDLITMNLRSRA